VTARFASSARPIRHHLIVALSAALCCLAVASPAWAAWSSPTRLSPATGDASEADVAVDKDGDSVIVWQRNNGTDILIQARTRTAAGVLGSILTLSAPGQDATEPEVAVDATGDAVFVWERSDGTNTRVQARARFGGVLSGVQTLSPPNVNATRARVEVDATGDAIFTWQLSSGLVQGRARSAAGALSAIQTLSPAGAFSFSPDVAIDADGDAVFAWTRFNPVNAAQQTQTRARSAAGALSAIQTLSPAGRPAARPSVAVNALTGGAVFAWERFDGTNTRVQARARSAAGALSPVQTLSLAGADALAPGVAVDTQGDAVFAWERAGVVQSRARSAAGALSAIQPLSGINPQDVELDVDKDRDAVFVWEREIQGVVRIQARTRSAAGALGAVRNLSPGNADADEPRVEVDQTGGAVSSWERGPTGARRVFAAVGP
jgi:hypothetical protein